MPYVQSLCQIHSDIFRYFTYFYLKMPFLWSLPPTHRPPESGHGSHCPLQIGGLVRLCVCGPRHPGCTPRGSSSDCSGLVGIEWVIRHDEFDLHGMSKHIILAYKQHILAFYLVIFIIDMMGKRVFHVERTNFSKGRPSNECCCRLITLLHRLWKPVLTWKSQTCCNVALVTASFSVTAATKEESMVETAMGLPAELGKSSFFGIPAQKNHWPGEQSAQDRRGADFFMKKRCHHKSYGP